MKTYLTILLAIVALWFLLDALYSEFDDHPGLTERENQQAKAVLTAAQIGLCVACAFGIIVARSLP